MVGIGPGNPLDRTHRAEKAILNSAVIVGYKLYVDLIKDLSAGKEVISSGMRMEVERVRIALQKAEEGNVVSLISSGDPGIYGMAGLAIELAKKLKIRVPVVIVPGVTAASAAAAVLGAPLMADFAVISLSDLLVSREQIISRLEAVARSGMVTVLYNPRSNSRTDMFSMALSIFRQNRSSETCVGIVSSASCEEQLVSITNLGNVDESTVDMRTIVIIGNNDTMNLDGKMVTSRGYDLK